VATVFKAAIIVFFVNFSCYNPQNDCSNSTAVHSASGEIDTVALHLQRKRQLRALHALQLRLILHPSAPSDNSNYIISNNGSKRLALPPHPHGDCPPTPLPRHARPGLALRPAQPRHPRLYIPLGEPVARPRLRTFILRKEEQPLQPTLRQARLVLDHRILLPLPLHTRGDRARRLRNTHEKAAARRAPMVDCDHVLGVRDSVVFRACDYR